MANAAGGMRPSAPQYGLKKKATPTPKPKDTVKRQVGKPKAIPTLKPNVKVAPMPTLSEEQKQDKALAELMKKRAAEAKKTGNWPNYRTN